MTSITERVDDQEKKLLAIEAELNKKKTKGWKLKVPWKVQQAVTKSNDKVAALWVGPNRHAEWKTATMRSGLWYIDDKAVKKTGEKDAYCYEEKAIFQLRQKKKLIPIVIFFSWRLLPGGGMAEDYEALIIGGKKSEDAAKETGIHKHGQLTIIRQIEQAEIDKDQKKKGSFGWIIWVVVLGVVGYLIMKMWG